jgi:transcriptional regulator with XRE-family HTH domain
MADQNQRSAVHSTVIRLLHEERERQGISQYELAPKAGLSASTLSVIERGLRNPTLDTLLRIAEVLEVELGELLIQASAEVRKRGKKK